MNSAEISEIKKRFTKTKVSTSKVVGCYVTGAEREIRTYIDDSFLNLAEEEMFKYLEIMRKTMSGTLGKNLLTLPFALDSELEGGVQRSLMALRDSELKSPEMLEAFYKHVIDNYDYAGNYLIILFYDAYDVPVKTEDNIKIDESVETYKYILCSICPVELSKPGLSYHEDENKIANRERDWVVESPVNGFLFPAFTDRSADIHNLLYYVKDTDEMHGELIEAVLGCTEKTPTDKQKETFQEIVTSVINEVPEYDTFEIVKNLNDTLTEIVEEAEEPVLLDKEDIKKIFKDSGLKEEHLETVTEVVEEYLGEKGELEAQGIVEKRQIKLKSGDMSIQVKPESADLIEVRVIDGRKCLVIPMDADIEVNGVMRRIREEMDSVGTSKTEE